MAVCIKICILIKILLCRFKASIEFFFTMVSYTTDNK